MFVPSIALALTAGWVATPAEPPPAAFSEAKVRRLFGAVDDDESFGKRLAAAGAYGPDALRFYVRVLGDPKEDARFVRAVLVFVTHSLKGDRARFLDPCVARLADPDTMVRVFAADLLAQIGTARDLAPVAVLLSDKDPAVRYAAARTLAAVGDRRALVAMDAWLAVVPPPTTGASTPERARRYVTEHRDKLKVRLDKEEKEKPKKPAK